MTEGEGRGGREVDVLFVNHNQIESPWNYKTSLTQKCKAENFNSKREGIMTTTMRMREYFYRLDMGDPHALLIDHHQLLAYHHHHHRHRHHRFRIWDVFSMAKNPFVEILSPVKMITDVTFMWIIPVAYRFTQHPVHGLLNPFVCDNYPVQL